MRSADIDLAIEMHRSWLFRFREALQKNGSQEIDVFVAADYRGCLFGQWLSGQKDLLEPAVWDQLNAQHIAFHLACGSIAKSLKEEMPASHIGAHIDRLERFSGLLCRVLEELKGNANCTLA